MENINNELSIQNYDIDQQDIISLGNQKIMKEPTQPDFDPRFHRSNYNLTLNAQRNISSKNYYRIDSDIYEINEQKLKTERSNIASNEAEVFEKNDFEISELKNNLQKVEDKLNKKILYIEKLLKYEDVLKNEPSINSFTNDSMTHMTVEQLELKLKKQVEEIAFPASPTPISSNFLTKIGKPQIHRKLDVYELDRELRLNSRNEYTLNLSEIFVKEPQSFSFFFFTEMSVQDKSNIAEPRLLCSMASGNEALTISLWYDLSTIILRIGKIYQKKNFIHALPINQEGCVTLTIDSNLIQLLINGKIIGVIDLNVIEELREQTQELRMLKTIQFGGDPCSGTGVIYNIQLAPEKIEEDTIVAMIQAADPANFIYFEQCQSIVKDKFYYCCGKGCREIGEVYGADNFYTSDTNVCRGARHAGVVTDSGNFFKVSLVKSNKKKFRGSKVNGVQSQGREITNEIFPIKFRRVQINYLTELKFKYLNMSKGDLSKILKQNELTKKEDADGGQ